jgi:hypothetical protein
MQATRPVDCDIALSSVQTRRAFHCATRADTAELEQPIEHRAVVSDVVLALLLREVVHVVRGDFVEKVNVLVGVELRHFVLGGRFGALDLSAFKHLREKMGASYVYLHLGVETVVHDQTMRHPYAVRLHRVPRYVGIVANI